MSDTARLRVFSANTNVTSFDFTRIVPVVQAAIDKAIENKADVLVLPELGFTGYTGGDYFDWIRNREQQKELFDLIQKEVAEYAAEKDPNLVISLGFPFFYADKTQDVQVNLGSNEKPAYAENPLYNINNHPFNAQAFITQGKIQAISAKTIQPNGAAEYEQRQFTSWKDYMGTQPIQLPDGSEVPFGKPVVKLKQGDVAVHLFHEMCAEAWPGVNDNGDMNLKEIEQGRYLSRLVKDTDISLIINPSASKPEPYLKKSKLRQLLCTLGSKIARGAAYIYTNCLGLESGFTAFEGGSIFVENGKVVHESRRYSMTDLVCSCCDMDVPIAREGKAHATVEHAFMPPGQAKEKFGAKPLFDDDGEFREYEERMRNTALWVGDYLKKTKLQGFVVSLSGGADSAFGALAITRFVDLKLNEYAEIAGGKEQAMEAFLNEYSHLEYADEVRRTMEKKGFDRAVDKLKERLLTCIYMPSENSSTMTKRSARTLIKGGKLPDGTQAEGIGGAFKVIKVQGVVDAYIRAFAGAEETDASRQFPKKWQKLCNEIKEYVRGERVNFSEATEKYIEESGIRFKKADIPTWANANDDITLQNLSARVRLPFPWLEGNRSHKIACVTSNWSEAIAGYWTFGGDGHMGAINLSPGIPKSTLRKMLHWEEERGVNGLDRARSLHYVNLLNPSAELKPLKQGKIAQFDENDMMPYEKLDAIAWELIVNRRMPQKVFDTLKGNSIFDNSRDLIACIEKTCAMWNRSQFKRIAAVNGPFQGNNPDPHESVRTTIFGGSLFDKDVAQLKLRCVLETIGNDRQIFEKETGKNFDTLMRLAATEGNFQRAVLKTPLPELSCRKISERDFARGRPLPLMVG